MGTYSFGMDLIPNSANSQSLGSASKKWNVYASTINGVDASEFGGGGSGLPSVSSSDNGKVLMVVNGEWALATLPRASGVSF